MNMLAMEVNEKSTNKHGKCQSMCRTSRGTHGWRLGCVSVERRRVESTAEQMKASDEKQRSCLKYKIAG